MSEFERVTEINERVSEICTQVAELNAEREVLINERIELCKPLARTAYKLIQEKH